MKPIQTAKQLPALHRAQNNFLSGLCKAIGDTIEVPTIRVGPLTGYSGISTSELCHKLSVLRGIMADWFKEQCPRKEAAGCPVPGINRYETG
jgi:hypothetical protein